MEWVQPEHREIHSFLIEWGNYLRTHLKQGHCASIEHRYKSPQCWDDRNPRPAEPNQTCALLVEGLMRIVPKLSRKILKQKYVQRYEPEFIAKRLRISRETYDQKLYTARQIVLNLTRHKLAPTIHGSFNNLSLSGLLAETAPLEGAFRF